MAELTPQASEQIVETCKSNIAAIAHSFNSAIGAKYELSVGNLRSGGAALLDEAHAHPGLMVIFEVGGQGIAVLISESLPVPGWYRAPNDNQKSRLQTLAMEWATTMLPPEIEASQYASIGCGELKRQLTACVLADEGHLLEISVRSPMGDASQSKFQMFWPLTTPRFQAVGDWPSVPDHDPDPDPDVDEEDEPEPVRPMNSRMQRLLRVPVSVVVRIAEKRIDLRQLRQLSPGMLLTFDKPCDAPLDVYVANHLYCRGEVVKMGENFAVKINETNSQQAREQKVFGKSRH